MTGWLISLGYVAVWLAYGWRLSIGMLDSEVRRKRREYPTVYETAEAAADSTRAFCVACGFGLALIWPIGAPARGAYRLVLGAYRLASGRGVFRTPAEVEEARERELVALRKLAREHGLPMPGDGA